MVVVQKKKETDTESKLKYAHPRNFFYCSYYTFLSRVPLLTHALLLLTPAILSLVDNSRCVVSTPGNTGWYPQNA